jgi:ligand-binding sensor domain-containing protein
MPTFDSDVSVSKQETVVDVMSEAEGLDANSVRAIVKSSDGNYYIGTSGNLQIFSFEEPEAGSGTAGAGTNDSAQKTSKTANDAAASEKSGGLKLLGTLT